MARASGRYSRAHLRNEASPIPPMNMQATEMMLETENADMPLIPCPEVQPPASRAPNTMAKPPAKADVLEIWLSTKLDVMSLDCGIAQAPEMIPRAKVMFLVDGRGAF